MKNFGLLQPQVFKDNRGSFREIFNMTKEPWRNEFFVQQNVSTNKKNVFRGMHYQYDNPQGKLITVLHGAVTDFIVDLREWSANFGVTQEFTLTAAGCETLWVPPCFAHGFLSLEEDTVFSYAVFENPRVEGDEFSISPYEFATITDALRGIDVIMSEKDQNGIFLKDAPIYD